MRCLVLAAALLPLVAGCGGGEQAQPPVSAPPAAEWLVDRAAESGLDFVHVNGMSGQYYEPEIYPPGAALLDYDNDGDLDLYVVQGQMLGPGKTPADAVLRDRLYRNDLSVGPDGRRTLHFVDVTATSGIDVRSYGMGAAAGDFNNDGWTDLYLTRLGPNVLLQNNGNGTFTDVSRRSRTDDPSWSVSAAFVDIDRDGWLDLYVGNYLRYALEQDRPCVSASGEPDYCDPLVYTSGRDRLYRNLRDGTFREVSAEAAAGGHGSALGVSTADFNGDGWIDVYVANDRQENDLWINQRDGTLRNEALLSGAALNLNGDAEASMGVDAGDFDNDGDEDLVIANFTGEGTTLYRNDGRGQFEDVGARSGLRQRSLPYNGFGNAWIDIDNDGWLDVLTVNGAVKRIEALAGQGDRFPFGQAKQLFRNTRDGRFEDVSDRAATVLGRIEVSRGAAFGDVDNDGDTDVVVANNNGPLRLLINEIGHRSRWLGLRLVGGGRGGQAGRDMLGARVRVERTDGVTPWRRARSDGSYASANDPRVLVGLGDASVAGVRVQWPDGSTEEFRDLDANTWQTLRQGTVR